MKFVWVGSISSEKKFPVANLPSNTVPFREPQTESEMLIKGLIFMVFLLFVCIIFLLIKKHKQGNVKFNRKLIPVGIILGLVAILPHELLHAIAYPKGATIEIGIIPRNLVAFAVSTIPMTKFQFIFMSILPSLILGLIPLIIFLIVPPKHRAIITILFIFGCMCLCGSYPDYLNIFNAIIQMPKGALTQLSGFHSYWYIP